MTKGKNTIDMTQGSIFKSMIVFVLPLIFGGLIQRLYSAADLIVVSRFSQNGSLAMASVGATGSICGLVVNLCVGMSLGAGVLVSRCFGAKDKEGMKTAVHTAMLLSVIMGLIAMVMGLAISEPVMKIMGTPAGDVRDGAVLYMRLYFLGVPAAMIYNFGASVMRAVGDTKRPLYVLIGSGLLNVVLNLLLVIVLHLDVAGVALATSASNVASAVAVVIMLVRNEDVCKLVIAQLKINKDDFKHIFRVGTPAGVQSALFDLSNSLIQSSVNSFGAAAVAGYSAGGNIDGIVYMAMTGFGAAVLTGVSQNYGAGNWKRMKQTVITALFSVSVVGFVVGILVFAFAKPLLGIYIDDSPAAIEFAYVLIGIVCPLYFMCGIMEVLTGAVRGMGYSVVPMINSLLGACGFRIFWITVLLPHCKTPQFLFACWPVSWIIVITLHTVYLMIIKKDVKRILLTDK